MKLITKVACDRCVKIKEYLKTHNTPYEEVYIEKPEDLQVYRQMLIDNGKELGFPILLENGEIINGNTEAIISWLTNKHQTPTETKYFWAN